MEDQDKHNSMEDLRDTEQSTSSLDKDTKENSWGHKIKKKWNLPQMYQKEHKTP